MMGQNKKIFTMIGLAGLALVIGQGCSQKSIRTTADAEEFGQGATYATTQPWGENQGQGERGSWAGNSGQGWLHGSQGGAQQDQQNQGQHGAWQYGESSPHSATGGSEGLQPEGPPQAFLNGVSRSEGETQQHARNQQGGLSYFGSDQNVLPNQQNWTGHQNVEADQTRQANQNQPWTNQSQVWSDGPLAALPEYPTSSGEVWGDAQAQYGQRGNMTQEFIQEDFDNIAQAPQPFTGSAFDQAGSYGNRTFGHHHARVQVDLQDVFFEFDSWRITPDGMQALAHDAEWLAQNHARTLTVEGHCDQRGTRDYNLVLGKKRAEAVRTYLVDLGVEAHKIQVISYGKERPFCFGHNEQCYQLNRRGHLQLHH